MGAVKKTDIPDIAAFMPAFWEFIKAVWVVEDADEYWEFVHFRANDLYEKYPSGFAKCMILAFCDYLDGVYQRQREDDKDVRSTRI